VKSAAFCFLIIAVAGCAGRQNLPTTSAPADHPPHQAPRGKYLSRLMTLYSVNVRTQGWHFLLMPEEFQPHSPGNYGNLYRVDELSAAFRSLPRGSTVVWRDDKFNAWIYPPEALQQRVERAAKSAGVELESIPSLVHLD
jgi:hypothetical protein